MTSSRDSLIPDVPDKSEAQARIDLARTEAQYGLLRYQNVDPNDRKALRFIGETGFARIVAILDGGRS